MSEIDMSLYSDLFKEVHGYRPSHKPTPKLYEDLLKRHDEMMEELPGLKAEWLEKAKKIFGPDVTYQSLCHIVDKIGPSHTDYNKALDWVCRYPAG